MARHGVDTAGLVRKKGVQTSATILPIRPNGERPALHVPGATRLFSRADIDLEHINGSRALLIGAPDALAGLTGQELADVAKAASSQGALVAVDVLHPGRPQDLERLAPLLGQADWFLPNADQLLALTGRASLADAMDDILALGTRGVAVTLGADGCLVATRQDPAAMAPARPRGRRGGHHRLRRRLHRRDARRAPARAQTPVDAAWLGVACGSLVATGLGSDAGIENLGQVMDFLERLAAGRGRPDQGADAHDRGHDRPAAARARQSRDPGRDVRPPGGPGRRLPAVHAGRPRGAGLGRGRERVRRPDVQLRSGRARPPAPGGGGRGRRAGRGRRLHERARPGHGGPSRTPRANRAARGLGDTRQERHRRHHHVLHDRPGADGAEQDRWSRRAPTTAPRRGARRARPG